MQAAFPRRAEVNRHTAETQITARINLDGVGAADIQTGVGFFDHMLHALTRHSLLDVYLRAQGDLHIDFHHTVEDCGIVLGQALRNALGEKRGIQRFGHCLMPMDEALVEAALDISGRPFLVWQVPFAAQKIGEMDTELFEEFFRALAMQAGVGLHITLRHGHNAHHIAEACFKAVARSLRAAVQLDPRMMEAIPSTKGVLET